MKFCHGFISIQGIRNVDEDGPGEELSSQLHVRMEPGTHVVCVLINDRSSGWDPSLKSQECRGPHLEILPNS